MSPHFTHAIDTLSLLLLLLLLLTTPSSTATKLSIFKDSLLPPTLDPFYNPPPNFHKTTPGTILRHRPLPEPLALPLNFTTNLAHGHQILYRTTDALGHASATVTTLLVPRNADDGKLLSYQVAEDSVSRDCAPSYGLLKGAVNASVGYEIGTIEAALGRGWYVCVPDYEGPKSAFTVGPQAGHATLDSIRAVLQSTSFTNLSATARTALWGYSGGALATEWATELAASYAPELEFVGAAAGGLTPNATSVFETVNSGPFAWEVVWGINGMAAAYPNMSRYLDKRLVPAMATKFRAPLGECSDEVAATEAFAGTDISSYFVNGTNVFTDAVPKSIIDIALTMGVHGTPTTPLYFYKAIADEISPVADTDALFDKYCAAGASITYQRNGFGEHSLDFILGAAGALGWLRERLEGVVVEGGCRERDVIVSGLGAGDEKLLGKSTYDYFNGILVAEGI